MDFDRVSFEIKAANSMLRGQLSDNSLV